MFFGNKNQIVCQLLFVLTISADVLLAISLKKFEKNFLITAA